MFFCFFFLLLFFCVATNVEISAQSLESLRTELTGTQVSYCYLHAQFSHHSQRALGKYSSLRLILKTIAQTTALRQKDGELLSWVLGHPYRSSCPFQFSTYGEVDKFHKAFQKSFFFIFFIFFPKADYEQADPPGREPQLQPFKLFLWVIEVM